MNEPRIRDVYQDYRRGRLPFERVVEAADAYLRQYAQGNTPRDAEGKPEPGHDHPST